MRSSSKRNINFEDNVVFDDDSSCFGPSKDYIGSEPAGSYWLRRLWHALLWATLVASALGFGCYNAWLMSKLHEAQTSFTRIKPIEREISFRTECGFYYYYYKKLVKAPSFIDGLLQLMNDKTSEHPSTVNALARFNIHPEVVLAFLQRFFGSKTDDPIFFYNNWVWFLQGVEASAMFVLAALVCRSITGAFLSSAMFLYLRPYVTRAFYSVAMRENFSMPFFWLRLLFLTLLFRSQLKERQKSACLCCLALSTFAFATSWQLSPFLLFVQGLPLFGGALIGAIDFATVELVIVCDASVIFIVGMLHFAYPLFLTSPAVTLAIAIFLTNRLFPFNHHRRFLAIVYRFICVVFAALFISGILKLAVGVADDNHVWKLFLAKLNLGYQHDFDVNLYLAYDIFRAQTFIFYYELTILAFFLFPMYATAHAVFLGGMFSVCLTSNNRTLGAYEAKKKDLDEQQLPQRLQRPSLLGTLLVRRPELSLHALICAPIAALGIFIKRLQLLWAPYMCIFYAWVLSTPAIYSLLPLPSILRQRLAQLMRYLLPGIVIFKILSVHVPATVNELMQPERYSVFKDKDMLELMEWIGSETRPDAVFTGCMHVMSAVHLSTGRAITNHPHYENLDLREKTRIIYEALYGRSEISQTYNVLANQLGVHYIILEYYFCVAPALGQFRMVDLIDAASGIQPEQGPFAGNRRLKQGNFTRMFCDVVIPDRNMSLKYVNDDGLTYDFGKDVRFARVFKNRAYYVYEVIP